MSGLWCGQGIGGNRRQTRSFIVGKEGPKRKKYNKRKKVKKNQNSQVCLALLNEEETTEN
jgi:hypothetical protein